MMLSEVVAYYFNATHLSRVITPIVLCATSYLLSVTNQQGNSYWLLLIDSLKEYIFIIFSLVKFSSYLSLSTISGNKRVILFSIFYFLTSGLITSQSTFSDIINNIPLSYLQDLGIPCYRARFIKSKFPLAYPYR